MLVKKPPKLYCRYRKPRKSLQEFTSTFRHQTPGKNRVSNDGPEQIPSEIGRQPL